MENYEKDKMTFREEWGCMSRADSFRVYRFDLQQNNIKIPKKSDLGVQMLKAFMSDNYSDETRCDCIGDPVTKTKCGKTSNPKLQCKFRTQKRECDPSCSTDGMECLNHDITSGRNKETFLLFRGDAGYGVASRHKILPEQLVSEYIGCIYDQQHNPYAKESVYTAAILYAKDIEEMVVAESLIYGNIARYFSSSHEPNAYLRVVKCQDEMRMGIFALKTIHPNEEITWFYGTGYHKGKILCCRCCSLEFCPHVHNRLPKFPKSKILSEKEKEEMSNLKSSWNLFVDPSTIARKDSKVNLDYFRKLMQKRTKKLVEAAIQKNRKSKGNNERQQRGKPTKGFALKSPQKINAKLRDVKSPKPADGKSFKSSPEKLTTKRRKPADGNAFKSPSKSKDEPFRKSIVFSQDFPKPISEKGNISGPSSPKLFGTSSSSDEPKSETEIGKTDFSTELSLQEDSQLTYRQRNLKSSRSVRSVRKFEMKAVGPGSNTEESLSSVDEQLPDFFTIEHKNMLLRSMRTTQQGKRKLQQEHRINFPLLKFAQISTSKENLSLNEPQMQSKAQKSTMIVTAEEAKIALEKLSAYVLANQNKIRSLGEDFHIPKSSSASTIPGSVLSRPHLRIRSKRPSTKIVSSKGNEKRKPYKLASRAARKQALKRIYANTSSSDEENDHKNKKISKYNPEWIDQEIKLVVDPGFYKSTERKKMSAANRIANPKRIETKGRQYNPEWKCNAVGCGKTFKSVFRFKQHLATHSKEKKFKCPVKKCQMSFHTTQKLNRHLDKHKPKKDRTKYKCRDCDKEFLRREDCINHMKRDTNSCTVRRYKIMFTDGSWKYGKNEVLSGNSSSDQEGRRPSTPPKQLTISVNKGGRNYVRISDRKDEDTEEEN